MADRMLADSATGELTTMQTAFTSTAFDTRVNNSTVGDLNPNSTTNNAAAAASNKAATATTPEPEPEPTPTPTPDPTPTSAFTVTNTGGVLTFGGTATGAVTMTTDGTNLTLVRGGITATTIPTIASVAAGGIPAVTLTAATFATEGVSALLANASATRNWGQVDSA